MEYDESVGRLSRFQAADHWTFLAVILDEIGTILLKIVQVLNKLLLELRLEGRQKILEVNGLGLELLPSVSQAVHPFRFLLGQPDVVFCQQGEGFLIEYDTFILGSCTLQMLVINARKTNWRFTYLDGIDGHLHVDFFLSNQS